MVSRRLLITLLVSFSVTPGYASDTGNKASSIDQKQNHQQNIDLTEAFNQAYRQSQTLAKSGKMAAAANAAKQALDLSSQTGASREEQANLLFNYGFLLLKSSQYEHACRTIKAATDEYSSLYGKHSPKLIQPLNELAICYAKNYSDRGKSLRAFKRIEKIAADHYGKDSEQHGRAQFYMGQTMLTQLRNKAGKKHLEKAFDIFSSLKGADSNEAIAAKFNLAKYYLADKRYESAIANLNDILSSFDDPSAPDTQLELSVHGFLVEAYEQNKQPQEATKHCLAIGKMTPEREIQDYIPLFKPLPTYPRSALQKGESGSVIVEFSVNEQGFVENPVVVDRQGSKIFDKPSLEVVKKFRYAPAFINGKAVKTDGVVNRIIYELSSRTAPATVFRSKHINYFFHTSTMR